jgi:peroxiredoxin
MRGVPTRLRGGRLVASVAAACLAVAALSGCTATALQQQYQDSDNKGYISGSGVTEIKPAQRKQAISFTGPTDDGSTYSSSAHRGDVVVVNFWYAGCPPCRLEAKALEKISTEFSGQGVDFIGINTRDDAATSKSYDSRFGVTYPSILDADSGKAQLAFSGAYRPNATPTTIVLDKQGRVAARVEGPINDQPSTLETLIRSALGEGS